MVFVRLIIFSTCLRSIKKRFKVLTIIKYYEGFHKEKDIKTHRINKLNSVFFKVTKTRFTRNKLKYQFDNLIIE